MQVREWKIAVGYGAQERAGIAKMRPFPTAKRGNSLFSARKSPDLHLLGTGRLAAWPAAAHAPVGLALTTKPAATLWLRVRYDSGSLAQPALQG